MKRIGRVITWIVRIIGLIALLLFILGIASYFIRPGELPSVENAPFAIQTYSPDNMRVPGRIYIAEEIGYLGDGTPFIKNYWTLNLNGESYKRHRGVKEFPAEIYGDIDIKRR